MKKLNYEEFKEYVVENIKSYLPESYANAEVLINPVMKTNNISLDGLSILPENNSISPTIYLNEVYDRYSKMNNSLDIVLKKIADRYLEGINVPKEFENFKEKFQSADYVKDKIVMTLINAERNAELLKSVPHRMHEDLACVYRVMVEKGSVLILNNHLDSWHFTEEDLYSLAALNAEEKFTPVFKTMEEMLGEMLDDFMLHILNNIPDEDKMYILTNDTRVYGASTMMQTNVLDNLAQRLNADLYILPSSIHECIAVSASKKTTDELRLMVHEVNENEVSEDEFLSDNVYFYDREDKTLKIAG